MGAALLHHFEDGGRMMYVLLALHVATLGVFAARAVVLVRARWGSHCVAPTVVDVLRRTARVEEALRLRGLRRTPIGRVLFVGLLGANGSVEHVEATMSAARVAEVSRLQRGAGWAVWLAAASMLLGIVGTVAGASISSCCFMNCSSLVRAAQLCSGISESATNNAFGIYSAALGALAATLATAWSRGAVSEIDRGVAQLTNVLHELRPWLRLHGTRPMVEARSYRL